MIEYCIENRGISMSEKTIKVTYHQLEVKEFPSGTTLKQICKHFQHYYDYDILVAKVDNEIGRASCRERV